MITYITDENKLIFDNNIFYFYSTKNKTIAHLMNNQIDKLSKDFNIIAIDIEFMKSSIKRFSLEQLPTLIYFDNGNETKRITGIKKLTEK